MAVNLMMIKSMQYCLRARRRSFRGPITAQHAQRPPLVLRRSLATTTTCQVEHGLAVDLIGSQHVNQHHAAAGGWGPDSRHSVLQKPGAHDTGQRLR